MAATSNPTVLFFDRLAEVGHQPLLRKTTGTARFDVVDGQRVRRWRVSVDKGDIVVEPGGGEADCVLRADRKVFERLATGRMNAVAAVLRGEISVEGDWRLLVGMQRLFAGPSQRGKKTA